MTARFLLSPPAQADLDDIWAWSIKRRGIDQAEIYIRQIAQHFAVLAAQPTLGRP